jgi:hypothetical protein
VLDIERSDGKMYALVLKDEISPLREDGGEPGGVGWVADVRPKPGGERLWVKWGDFKAMYRGREGKDAEPLERGEVKRVSVMCRRWVGIYIVDPGGIWW